MPDMPGSIQSSTSEIGRRFLQLDFRLVAARGGIDLVAFGFEIVAQEQRKRLLVLDDQDAGAHGALFPVHAAGNGTVVDEVVSPFGRSSMSARPSAI